MHDATNIQSGIAGGIRRQVKPQLVPASSNQAAPLSFAQQRLWFIAQSEAGSVAYNEPFFVRLEGRLDVTVLEQSLQEIVHRHKVLRTTFAEEQGRLVQLVASRSCLHLPVESLESQPETEREKALLTRARQELLRPFHLEQGPPLRAMLLRMAPQEHVLLVVMHHIVSDGWSMGVLERELGAIYAAIAAGVRSDLPPLPVQYGDYAAWQREWLSGEVLDEQLDYWTRCLAGSPPHLELPTDRPRRGKQTFNGALHQVRLPEAIAAAVRELSRAEGVTLYMALLAVFHTLLARYSGQSDIVVGSPIAGRNHSKVEGLIGCFVNSVALRVEISEEVTYRELLARVQKASLGAESHQDVPFELVVNALQAKRDPARTPVFQVMFEYQSASFGLSLPGLSVRELPFDPGLAKFDLTLLVRDAPDGMACVWEYNTALFDEATIVRMARHYQLLLQGAVGDPDRPMSRLPLLTAEEEHAILVQWNANERELPQGRSIQELFERQVERTPDAAAVVDRDRVLTFRELNERSNRMAHRLQELGVGPEVVVGICMNRSVGMVAALLGVLKAGGAYVPLDPAYPESRLSFMLEDSGSLVLIAEDKLLEKLQPRVAHIVRLDVHAEALRPGCSVNPAPIASPDQLAYVIYTSGSTGRPKGVMVNHRALLNLQQAFHQVGYADQRRQLRIALNSSFSFDASLQQLVQLTHGHTLCLVPPEAGEDLAALFGFLDRERVDAVECSPSQLRLMLNAGFGVRHGRTISRVIVGGEAIDEALWAQLADHLSIKFFNLYGPTECTVDVACCAIQGDRSGPSLGRPLANCRVYVLDGGMRPVPIGVPGELYIGGIQVGRGYRNLPSLTAQSFVPDNFGGIPGARLYRTGDRVRYRADGKIEFLGRVDDQVKLRGFRIELGEVEASIKLLPGVTDAVVLAREFSSGDMRLVAYVVSPGLEAEVLRARIKERLPRHMVPSAIVIMANLPLTTNGKVDRKALPMPDGERLVSPAGLVAPRDAVELQLLRIWEEVLGVHPLGVRDNFFDAGGHSLLAVQLLWRIEEVMGRRLAVTALIDGGTVEHLARLLRQEADGWSPLVEFQRGGSDRRPLFLCHPVGGGVLCYTELAHLLGPDLPVYGLQAHWDEQGSARCQTVEEMAAYFLAALRRVQPEGPYLIGGWSMGGNIAFEASRQLQGLGEQVDLLVLIDSYSNAFTDEAVPPEHGAPAWLTALFYRDLLLATGHKPPFEEEALLRMQPEERDRLLEKAAAIAAAIGFAPESLNRMQRVFENNLRALLKYKPGAYHGVVASFEAMASLGSHGWEQHVCGKLILHRIAGDHDSILRPPQVHQLALALRHRLDEAEAAHGAHRTNETAL